LPQVASDPVVSRPLRPESLSGRTGAPAGEPSGAFEGLLDAPAAQRSRPERPADRSETKPADTPNAPPAKNGQSADAGEPLAKAAETVAGTTPIPPVDFAAIAEALTVQPQADAKPVEQMTDDAPVTPDQSKGSDDAAVPLAANATVAPPAAAAIAVALPAPLPAPSPAAPPPAAAIAVALPTSLPAKSPAAPPAAATTAVAPPAFLPATSPVAAVNSDVAGIASAPNSDVAGIAPAPVELQSSAPAIPSDAANPDAATLPALAAEPSEPAPAKPQIDADAAIVASVEKAAPSDDAQKAAALKAAVFSETADARDATSPAPTDRKTESGKVTSNHPGLAARTPDTQPRSDAPKPALDAVAEQDMKAVPHQQRHETAERASLTARTGAADARPELPVTAAPQAQIHAAGPMPFGLALHAAIPLALSPFTALRIDTPGDHAIPVAGLAVEIVSRAQDGLRRFDIRLDPPELGRIDVRLDVDTAGKVTSRLTVERAETLDLLRRDAPQLERALQHAGLNTEGGLEFSLRDQNFANREQAPRNPAATQLIVPDDEAAAAEAARRGYGRMIGLGGGVDIRV